MRDDKRLLREMKREVKKRGNRKRRRYLKDVHADPEAFDFGGDRSEAMNVPAERNRRMRREPRGRDDE